MYVKDICSNMSIVCLSG